MSPPFRYRGGTLCAEAVPLDAIAGTAGTPAYVYSGGHMRHQLQRLQDAFAGQPVTVCYALKANSNLAVVRTLAAAGAGAEIVSGGELQRALAAGVPPGRIVFAGVGKSRAEMAMALEVGIAQLNVESVPELIALSEVAASRRQRAPVGLRINPDVAAGSHDKISTGRRQDKFGIPYDQALETYRLAQRLAGIEVVGLHLHIGSQILSLAPFEAAFRRAVDLARQLCAEGIAVRRLDLGGGLGVGYRGEPEVDLAAYAALVRDLARGLDLELVLEPGRFLVAQAGVLLSRVLYVKEGAERPCVILDAGMNDLLRPALYDAYHPILPVIEPEPGAPRRAVDVVGVQLVHRLLDVGGIHGGQLRVRPVSVADVLADALRAVQSLLVWWSVSTGLVAVVPALLARRAGPLGTGGLPVHVLLLPRRVLQGVLGRSSWMFSR